MLFSIQYPYSVLFLVQNCDQCDQYICVFIICPWACDEPSLIKREVEYPTMTYGRQWLVMNGTWHGFLFRNGPLLLGPPLSEQKVEMKNWPPNFFCVCLPALSIKSCMKNQVGPISTFHRKVAVKVGPQLFTATFRWKVEILGVEWIIMWINFKWQRNISSATTTSELPVFVVTMTLYRQEDSRRLTTRAMKTAALNVATTTLLATATSLSADNNERL